MTQILIKRDVLANIGTLTAGELYLATDTLDLYVGSASGNKLVGGIAALLAKAPALGADDNYVTDTQKTNLNAGATGTFTTVDSKTVTVTGGIITNIV